MARVIWTPEALEDIESVRDSMLVVAPEGTSRLLTGIIGAVRNLPSFPRSGRLVPDLDRGDIREVIHRQYRIIYRVDDRTLWILRVSHGAQDLSGWMRELDAPDQ